MDIVEKLYIQWEKNIGWKNIWAVYVPFFGQLDCNDPQRIATIRLGPTGMEWDPKTMNEARMPALYSAWMPAGLLYGV